MPAFHQTIVVGHLGRDPEVKTTAKGMSVCSFSIAVTEKGKDEHTEWYNCVAFDKTADVCAQYLKKGDAAMVVGRMRTEEYEGKDGTKKKSVKLLVDRMQMLGGKAAQGDAPRAAKAAPGPTGVGDMEDDIPFVSCDVSHDVMMAKLSRRRRVS